MNLILSLSLKKAMQPRTRSRILAVFADSLQLAGKRGQLIGVSSWEVVPVRYKYSCGRNEAGHRLWQRPSKVSSFNSIALVGLYSLVLLLKSCGGRKHGF